MSDIIELPPRCGWCPRPIKQGQISISDDGQKFHAACYPSYLISKRSQTRQRPALVLVKPYSDKVP